MGESRAPGPIAQRNRGGTPLVQYRLYFLRESDGRSDAHISRVHEFEAASDEQAVRICEGWREGRPAELWCGGRKVCDWSAD